MKILTLLLLLPLPLSSGAPSGQTTSDAATGKAALAAKVAVVTEMLRDENSPLRGTSRTKGQLQAGVFYAGPIPVKVRGKPYTERTKTFSWKGAGLSVSEIDEGQRKLVLLTEVIISPTGKGAETTMQEKSCTLCDGAPLSAVSRSLTQDAKNLFAEPFPDYQKYDPVKPADAASWAEFSLRVLGAAIEYGTPPEADESIAGRLLAISQRLGAAKRESLAGYAYSWSKDEQCESWSFEHGSASITVKLGRNHDGKIVQASVTIRPASQKLSYPVLDIIDWSGDGSVDLAIEKIEGGKNGRSMDRNTVPSNFEGAAWRKPVGIEHAKFWREKYLFALNSAESFLDITPPR